MTRSAWVGFAFASLIGLIYIIKNFDKCILKRAIYIVVGCGIIIYLCLFPPKFINISNYNTASLFDKRLELMNEEFNILFSDSKDNNLEKAKMRIGSGRVAIWKLTLKLISKSPLLGSGPDTLIDGLLYHLKDDTYNYILSTNGYFDKAHNEYLQIAATIGIPALIVYLAFIAQIIAKSKNMFRNSITFIFIVPIISYLVQAFFNISTIGVAPIFWCLLGLLQNEDFRLEIKNQINS